MQCDDFVKLFVGSFNSVEVFQCTLHLQVLNNVATKKVTGINNGKSLILKEQKPAKPKVRLQCWF